MFPFLAPHRGLSPRVRGIPHYATTARYGRRSIPACTGNPPPRIALYCVLAVYPRVYGESYNLASCLCWQRGLSPRVRGIRMMMMRRMIRRRSIPACTGNPPAHRRKYVRISVYPRVYGESTKNEVESISYMGLSPRVRGILLGLLCPLHCLRSIPACTGNPDRGFQNRDEERVYPRVYGESSSSASITMHGSGLSPRVRGIRRLLRPIAPIRGSIPACTGNPS